MCVWYDSLYQATIWKRDLGKMMENPLVSFTPRQKIHSSFSPKLPEYWVIIVRALVFSFELRTRNGYKVYSIFTTKMLIVSLLVTIPIVEKMAAIFVSDSEVYPSLDLDRAS